MERIPIFKMGGVLLVTIQTDVRDRLLEALEEDLGARIRDAGAHGVLLDISALEVLDLFTARMLEGLASMTRLLGAETVVVGMRPAVAVTLLEMGRTFDNVATAVSVESGMDRIARGLESSIEEAGADEASQGQETESSTEAIGGADRARLPPD